VQLVKENPALARVYRDRSVAEQNSVDLTWEILMDNRFAKLRAAIYTDEEEFLRFRQLVVNSVMAVRKYLLGRRCRSCLMKTGV
jgi:hypothetical protein